MTHTEGAAGAEEGIRLVRLPDGTPMANVRLAHRLHPEAGVDWGNQGAGAVNLAVAALMAFGLTLPEALWLHQEFIFHFLLAVHPAGGEISAALVRDWTQHHRCRHYRKRLDGPRLLCATCRADLTLLSTHDLPPEAKNAPLQAARRRLADEAARGGHGLTRISYDLPAGIVAGGCGTCGETLFVGFSGGATRVLAPDAFPCGDPLTPAGQRRAHVVPVPADDVRAYIRKALGAMPAELLS